MSLWKIAWRSIQQRKLASALTALSMALGVALVVTVIVVYEVIDQSFRRGAQGYELIVGPKGSPLDLVLTSVYHIGRAPGTMPYYVYDELINGQFSSDVEVAIPICMGDTFKGFRVIGTHPDMFERLEYLDGRQYEFAEGRNFRLDAPFEAVVGSVVARKTGLKVGEKFRPVHGSAVERGVEHDPFEVVGVLAPTGTPNDRAIFVNMEGFYHLHTKPPEEEEAGGTAGAASSAGTEADSSKTGRLHEKSDSHKKHKLSESEKQLTAVLVVLNPNMIATRRVALPKLIAKELEVQAVRPSEEITRLLEGVVGRVQLILLILAVMIVIVAGIGIMVSIYNSMSDRRREIAIIRALGARRSTIMVVVLLESILLALGGGAVGLVVGHALTGVAAAWIGDQTGVPVNPLQFQLSELILIPFLVVLAAIVGFLPAVVAYRTDVAQSLVSSP